MDRSNRDSGILIDPRVVDHMRDVLRGLTIFGRMKPVEIVLHLQIVQDVLSDFRQALIERDLLAQDYIMTQYLMDVSRRIDSLVEMLKSPRHRRSEARKNVTALISHIQRLVAVANENRAQELSVGNA